MTGRAEALWQNIVKIEKLSHLWKKVEALAAPDFIGYAKLNQDEH